MSINGQFGHSLSGACVPLFEKFILAEKKCKYCIVIPVINEGLRIKSLLMKMHALAIASQADIIIVDGGSTDGSLGVDILSKYNVSALLTKTGPGKLSAQLQCAYYFALGLGYNGIVTIDGNDKDDPVAISNFLRALDQGYDFAQASRFIPGGISENTPFSRYVAIRLIHAPLLSLASGFKWTDTTQGFRAYSSRLLLDGRIAPFRSVFSAYELLAYLSYRAPRLGYKCIELPTSRMYPIGEIPTKISGFKGNLIVLKTLIMACLGLYNPPSKF
ncbi:glycosyltransferase family 2 protein [Leeia oryzae]|uniref:glycosyltransferase family 2 protein n=1 Tax=Leeia oryzae TaxID=356662 RepID=UPI000686FC19|nr:glycosyltransferase family 2 protein [Leeia oryzae]